MLLLISLTAICVGFKEGLGSKGSDPLPPSLMLLGAGASWAAAGGHSALYIGWLQNIIAHPNPWWYWEYTLSTAAEWDAVIAHALRQYGFSVDFVGDIPPLTNLSAYSVVVISAYWACEPGNEPIIRSYISSGGGVVLIGGVPSYFAVYDKDWWATGDLSPIEDWFGASTYLNSGMDAIVAIDNPFGTSLIAGDSLGFYPAMWYAAVTGLHPDANTIATWTMGPTFSFTHTYGAGRVYYQASYTIPPTISATVDIDPDTLNLKSKGKWITAYIELPGGYDVADINVSTITMNDIVPAELRPTAIGDYDNDTVPDLMVKFNRTAVSELILSEGISYGNVTLIITGFLNNGTLFAGSDVIRARMPGDVDCNGKVDIFDVVLVAVRYGMANPEPYYDINEDGKIDIFDIVSVAVNYGKTYQ